MTDGGIDGKSEMDNGAVFRYTSGGPENRYERGNKMRARQAVRECLVTELNAMKRRGQMVSLAFSDVQTLSDNQRRIRSEADAYFKGLYERQVARMEARIEAYTD